MSMTIFCAPQLPKGRVIVIQDGVVVADGWLDDLVKIDEDPEVHSDIYMHPDDAADYAAWCRAQRKRRLN